MSHHRSKRSPPCGFTLVEVMVALTLLSIGLLGSARMQLFSTQTTHAAYLRGQAVTLVRDFIDRIQANPLAANSGNYNSVDIANYAIPVDNGCTETSVAPASTCTPAELAAHDRWEWSQSLTAILPNGTGSVCKDSNPDDGVVCDSTGNIYTVSISWDRRESGVMVTKQYAARVEP